MTEEMATKARTPALGERNKGPEQGVVCVDLFCGAGGLTHGLNKAGVRVVAGADFDEACEHPYTANHEGAAFFKRDVEKLEASEIESWFGKASVRVLAGCAPCQPFSSYSQRYEWS